jgi:hypothetical protein
MGENYDFGFGQLIQSRQNHLHSGIVKKNLSLWIERAIDINANKDSAPI